MVPPLFIVNAPTFFFLGCRICYLSSNIHFDSTQKENSWTCYLVGRLFFILCLISYRALFLFSFVISFERRRRKRWKQKNNSGMKREWRKEEEELENESTTDLNSARSRFPNRDLSLSLFPETFSLSFHSDFLLCASFFLLSRLEMLFTLAGSGQ